MRKAASTSSTNTLKILNTESIERTAPNQMLVTMRADDGGAIAFTMTTAMLMQLVNLSVKMINDNLGAVFRDVGL